MEKVFTHIDGDERWLVNMSMVTLMVWLTPRVILVTLTLVSTNTVNHVVMAHSHVMAQLSSVTL